MALLTKKFLQSLGIQLSDSDYETLSGHFETTLHSRIINEVVEELTLEQAEELAHLQQIDSDTIDIWLQNNVPSLNEIVSDEVDILLGELAESAEKM